MDLIGRSGRARMRLLPGLLLLLQFLSSAFITSISSGVFCAPQNTTNNDASYLGGSFFKSIMYDDQYMIRYLNKRLPYLKKLDESNKTIGYVGIRDYFNLGKVFWPSNDYLAEKNLEEYLYEEQKAFDVIKGIVFTDDHWQYSNAKELAESGGPEANETRCEQDLHYLYQELASAERNPQYLYEPGRRRMELLRWIDAWGRPPSEAQWGNSFWSGSYRACKLASVPTSDNQNAREIKFNFCWAKLQAKDWPTKDVMIPKLTLRSAMCLPRSCDTTFARRRRATLKDMIKFNYSPMQRQRYLSRPIDDVYCLPLKLASVPEGSRWSREAIWFFRLTGAWLCLVSLASLSYYLKRLGVNKKAEPPSFIRQNFECLALQRNWQDLIDDREPSEQARLDLRVLSLIKLMSCLMVLFAHCTEYFYWFSLPVTILIIETRRLEFLIQAWFFKSIDVFMITSGVLTAYTLLTKLSSDNIGLIIKPKVYILLQLARYLRLAPVLVYGFALLKGLFVHLSEGPYWDYATYELSLQARCRKASWWRQLIWPILIDFWAQGGDPHQNECMPSSWYIVTDMKMFLIVPFYFYILYRKKSWRLHILGATMLVSTLWNYVQVNLQQLFYFRQYLQYGTMHVVSITVGYFETSYYSPMSRFYALALGLYAGIHLFRYKQGKIKRWPWFMRGFVIWLACSWHLYDLIRPILAEIHFRQTNQVPSEESLTWSMLLRQRIDALTIVILILRLCTDWSRVLMRNANFCFRLSKLSYCVYIVHTQLIIYLLSATQFSRPDSDALQLALFSVVIITTSFAIALPVYLLIESPLALLLNQMLDKSNLIRKHGQRSLSAQTDGKMVKLNDEKKTN